MTLPLETDHTSVVTLAACQAARAETRKVNLERYLRFRGTVPGEPIALEALEPTSRMFRGYRALIATTCQVGKAADRLREADEDILPMGTFVHQNALHSHVPARYGTDEWVGVKDGGGIKDADIARRRGFYIDLDANRPSGLSSTDAEEQAACVIADRVIAALVDILGDARPVGVGLSGNGAHVHLALADLSHSATLTTIINDILQITGVLFDTEQVKVDQSVGDARRPAPAYGSKKRKGANYAGPTVPDDQRRPHRTTAFVCHDDVRRLSFVELVAVRDALRARAPSTSPAAAPTSTVPAPIPVNPPAIGATAPARTTVASTSSPWAQVNAINIETVSEWLGLGSGQNMTCPGCGSTDGYGLVPGKNLTKCHHASCANKGNPRLKGVRSVIDLTMETQEIDKNAALKVLAHQFGISLPVKATTAKKTAAAPPAAKGAAWELDLIRDESERLEPWIANAVLILRNDPAWTGVVAYNELQRAIIFSGTPPEGFLTRATGDEWVDDDDTACATWLQRTWRLSLALQNVRSVVSLVAHYSPFHPLRDWLASLTWDGSPRVDSWLDKYFGVEVSPYSERVGRWWLVSAVARVFAPGCKVDTILVLEGKQGLGKSTALRVLASDEYFLEDMRDIGGVEALKQLSGKWIVEWAELDAVRKAENSTIKKFTSTCTDTYRPSYGRSAINFPRSVVFCGTTNHTDSYLADETGARRWWPVLCTAIDIEALKRDRAQLWAEAVALFQSNERWWPETMEDHALCGEQQGDRGVEDIWTRTIRGWVVDHETVSTADILTKALGFELSRIGDRERKRVADVLRALGWQSVKTRKQDGRQFRGFTRGPSAEPMREPTPEELRLKAVRHGDEVYNPFVAGSMPMANRSDEATTTRPLIRASDVIS